MKRNCVALGIVGVELGFLFLMVVLAGFATTLLAVNSVATSLSYYQESLMTNLPGHANLTVGLHRALTQNDLAPDSPLLPDAAPRSEERTQRERRLAALPWGTTLSHTFTLSLIHI